MNIYVGNISYNSTEDTVRALFAPFGEVKSVKLITDRETGRPRGFGFVEMPNTEEAQAAIAGVDGKELDGRTLQVKEARPKPDRGPGGRRPPRDE